MTTATIPDVDLEAWLNHELDRRCDLLRPDPALSGPGINIQTQCKNAAEWLLSAVGECGHVGAVSQFMCVECHSRVVHEWWHVCCVECHSRATITWVERVRSPQ